MLNEDGNCPQNEEQDVKIENWQKPEQAEENDVEQTNNDDGYEGDMEGDGGLMPPPSTVPLVPQLLLGYLIYCKAI